MEQFMSGSQMNEFMVVYKRRLQLYVGERGDPRLLPREKSEQILLSIQHCITAYDRQRRARLRPGDTPPLESVDACFRKGLDLLIGKLQFARELQTLLSKNLIATQNRAYQVTLLRSIPQFLQTYDVQFFSQMECDGLVYPLCLPLPDIDGVEKVLVYLQRFQMEEFFLDFYGGDELEMLQYGYSPMYRDLQQNIFELALHNAIGRALLEKDPLTLQITQEDRDEIQAKLTGQKRERNMTVVLQALSAVLKAMDLRQDEYMRYFKLCALTFCDRLQVGLAACALDNFFITPKPIKKVAKPTFEDDPSFTPREFISMEDEIIPLQTVSAKLERIKELVHSLADLAVLFTSCFKKEEHWELYRLLQPAERELILERVREQSSYFGDEDTLADWQKAFLQFAKQTK